MEKYEISANLMAIRKSCTGQIAQIAARLDIHRVSLSRKLHGHIPFKLQEILDICDFLNCSIEDLLSGKISPNRH